MSQAWRNEGVGSEELQLSREVLSSNPQISQCGSHSTYSRSSKEGEQVPGEDLGWQMQLPSQAQDKGSVLSAINLFFLQPCCPSLSIPAPYP